MRISQYLRRIWVIPMGVLIHQACGTPTTQSRGTYTLDNSCTSLAQSIYSREISGQRSTNGRKITLRVTVGDDRNRRTTTTRPFQLPRISSPNGFR